MKKLILSVALVLSAGNSWAMFIPSTYVRPKPQLQGIIYIGPDAAALRSRYDQLKAKPTNVRTVYEQNEMDALSKKLGLSDMQQIAG